MVGCRFVAEPAAFGFLVWRVLLWLIVGVGWLIDGLGVWFSVVCCWVLGFGFPGAGCVGIDSLVGSGCFVWITVLGLADWGGGFAVLVVGLNLHFFACAGVWRIGGLSSWLVWVCVSGWVCWLV